MTPILNISFKTPKDLDDLVGVTTIVFMDDTFRVGNRAKQLLEDVNWILVHRAATEAGFRGKVGEHMVFFAGDRRFVFVGISDEGEMIGHVDLGGHTAAAAGFAPHVLVVCETPQSIDLPPAAVAEVALGFRLWSYRFDTYRTQKAEQQIPERRVTMLTTDRVAAAQAYLAEAAVAEGVELARTLVNEPANVLTPQEFARRISALTEYGLDVEIMRESDLERLGFRALLAVGQGSAQETYVALLRWRGAPSRDDTPLAFVGKGVCFDTGGISIKRAAAMADMKGDMAGAASVVGLLLALARRNAPINAIGAVGLVENMPDGRAQRPGDIVRSLSGQTIEVTDTDYEGRLVLADLLWHVQANDKPRFMVDLATLTGAVAVALGLDHAGLFTNDDDLADQFSRASKATGELTWRLPLGASFDKAMNSKFADVRNIDPDYGGASTAASFIQRFVNNVPWVHLDISGPAQDLPESPICRSWGTGWGVRLLDRLVRNLEPTNA
ncbi:putative cytosol aminopeptidase (plasmid) [Agrobacterium vitis]|uniref:leucyl aminopeptidase n=1 Tax=Agrobacterium vitis TaxID=373 RepID=UPI0015D956A7|nr:leucyl aminopeptidase [Agrobacterium vitis]BCH62632.1 putative cytosol aminopeptidase [Agrobacterium vitis]